MKKHLSVLALGILSAAIIGGCGSEAEKPKDTGSAQMALSTTVGDVDYCVTGTILILDSDENVVSEIPTDCEDTDGHEVILLPGLYTVEMDPDPPYTCMPTETSTTTVIDGYAGCEMIPLDEPFEVVVGSSVDVPLSFRFFYQNTEDETVLFGVGSAVVTLGEPTDLERCGEGPDADICDPGEICALLDGDPETDSPSCYEVCNDGIDSGTTACSVEGDACVPVATLPTAVDGGEVDDGAPDVPPAVTLVSTVPVGTEADLDSLLALCVTPPEPVEE